MNKIIKTSISILILLFIMACEISSVEVGKITMEFTVDSKSPLIGEKLYIIYDDEYSGTTYDYMTIDRYNTFIWYGDNNSLNYDSGTAMYEFIIRIGEDNKYNTTNQNRVVFSFAPESDESEDHDRREIRVLRTNHEDITAYFDVRYEYSTW